MDVLSLNKDGPGLCIIGEDIESSIMAKKIKKVSIKQLNLSGSQKGISGAQRLRLPGKTRYRSLTNLPTNKSTN